MISRLVALVAVLTVSTPAYAADPCSLFTVSAECDAASAGGWTVTGDYAIEFIANSGVSGEKPKGNVIYSIPNAAYYEGHVTGLCLSGNKAVVVGFWVGEFDGSGFIIQFEDREEGLTDLGQVEIVADVPKSCPPFAMTSPREFDERLSNFSLFIWDSVLPGSQELDAAIPCAGPNSGGAWATHGQYMGALLNVVEGLVAEGRLTADDGHALVGERARNDCGK